MVVASWDEGLETGNEVIDSQHRELNAFVNALRDCDEGSYAEVLAVLDTLMDFAVDHVMLEEELMRQVGYPPEPAQRMIEQHHEFKQRSRALVLAFRQGEPLGLKPLRSFLEGFLAVHESGEDRLLATWIRERDSASRPGA